MQAQEQAYAAMFEGGGARQLGRGALALGSTGFAICVLSALMALSALWPLWTLKALVVLFVLMSMAPLLGLKIAHGRNATLDEMRVPLLIGAIIAITAATLVGMIGQGWLEAAVRSEGQALPVSAQLAQVYHRGTPLWWLFSLSPALMMIVLYLKARLR